MYKYYISALYIQCTVAPCQIDYTSPVTNKAAPAPAPDCVITVEEECEERTEVACSVLLYCTILYCTVLHCTVLQEVCEAAAEADPAPSCRTVPRTVCRSLPRQQCQ